jgi:hypothetical protein
MLVRSSPAAYILLWSFFTIFIYAQPSPEQQARIAKAIAAASNQTGTPDFTAFVNPFIGTGMSRACMRHLWDGY